MIRFRKSVLVSAVILAAGISYTALGSRSGRTTERWALEGALSASRAGACTLRAANGQWLMIGGDGADGPLSTVEVWGGGTVASMSTARTGHFCSLLPDSRILVAGGRSATGDALASSEIFDPATGEWSAGANLTTARANATATALRDGRVLIAGGVAGGAVLNTTEIFDPTAAEFSDGPVMSSARRGHSAVVTPDGSVWLIGGFDGNAPIDSIDVFSPATGQISMAARMAAARQDFSATVLDDGRIFIAGGAGATGDLAGTELFQPLTRTLSAGPAMSAARSGHQAWLLPQNNSVLIAGGNVQAEIFVPWLGEMKSVGAMRAARKSTAGLIPGDGTVVVAGGTASAKAVDYIETLPFARVSGSVGDGHNLSIGGAGWQPGETVLLRVESQDATFARNVTLSANDRGEIATNVDVGSTTATLMITAKGAASGSDARQANDAANLDQCQNGKIGTAKTACDWSNGNTNENNSQYVEGDSIAYRVILTNLAIGTNTLTLQWDTTKSGKHAIDFLTSWNVSNFGDPCAGIAGCGSASTFAWPTDPLAGSFQNNLSRNLTAYNVSAVTFGPYVGSGTFPGGDSANKIQLTITATSPTVVLAWGGHIATRLDWGPGSSAVSISGSPYHTRVLELNGSGGNQDRSLSASAITYPAIVTVIKQTDPDQPASDPSFNFTNSVTDTQAPANAPATFSLKDNGQRALTYVAGFASGTTISPNIVEPAPLPAGWSFQNVSCQVVDPGLEAPTITNITNGVTLALHEGNSITCTFNNKLLTRDVKLVKSLSPSDDPGKFALTVGNVTTNNNGNGGSATKTAVTIGSSISISEAAESGTDLANYTSSLSCDNSVTVNNNTNTAGSITIPAGDGLITCTVTNTRKTRDVKLVKSLSPTDDPGKFALTVGDVTTNNNGNGGSATKTAVPVGTSISMSEAAESGTDLGNYTSSLSCGAVTVNNNTNTAGSITVPAGDGVLTCTVTNTRKTRDVKLVKSLSPTDDPGKFALTVGDVTTNNNGNGGSATKTAVPVGTSISMNEAAESGTDLAFYTSTLACDNSVTVNNNTNTAGSITIPAGDGLITCTVTNTRKTRDVKLVKSLSPTDDPGKFALTVGSVTTNNNGNGGSATKTAVPVGTSISMNEAAESGTDLTFYTSTLACDNSITVNNNTNTAGSITVPVGDGLITCTVTNTRKTRDVKLVKSLSPTDDPGKFALTIGDVTTNNNGNGGSATKTAVPVGTSISMNEAAESGTDLAFYTSTLACDNSVTVNNNTNTAGSITVPVGDGLITCTVTNTRKTRDVKLVKSLSPTDDPGKFALTIGDVTTNNNGNGGSATKTAVPVGTSISMNEAAESGTDLANYTSSLSCGAITVNNNTNTAGSITVPVGDGLITCTVTNTRKTRDVKLVKSLSPTDDPGKFALTIGDVTTNNNGNGGSATKTAVPVGTSISMNEAAESGTNLANYTSSLSCGAITVNNNTNTAGSITVPAGDGLITCTVTNTRKTRDVKLVKSLSPTDDPGKFALTVGDVTTNNNGNGGSATKTAVPVGSNISMNELAESGTDLGNYNSSLSCGAITVNNNTNTAGSITVPVGDGLITCTVTNTRKSRDVKLVKALSPTDDPGKFALTVGDVTTNNNGNGGSATKTAVAVGAVISLGEAAEAGTDLGNYASSLSCGAVSVTNNTGTTGSITVPAGDSTITCTVTNTRKTRDVKLVKSLSPTDDPGKFALTVGDVTTNNNGNGGSATKTAVPVGTSISMNELAESGTDLANYTSSLSCGAITVNNNTNTAGSITVPAGDGLITCTVTNTRKTRDVKLVKSLSPTDDPGKFALTVGNVTTNNNGNGGSATKTAVPVGSNISMNEAAESGTDLANYTSSLSCGVITVNNNTNTAGSITVPAGDGLITCTVTNTRKVREVKLVKELIPANDAGKFALTVGDVTTNGNGNGGFATKSNVSTGAVISIGEAAEAGTTLADYTSALECDSGVMVNSNTGTTGSITVPTTGSGTITCKVTNTRKGKLTVVKNTTGGDGTFNFSSTVPQNGSFSLTTASGTKSTQFTGLAGNSNLSVAELAVPNGWEFVSVGCTGVTANVSGQSASFTLPAGGDVTCTFTNRKLAKLTIVKNTVGGNGTFQYTGDLGAFSLTTVANTQSKIVNNLQPNTYSVTESALSEAWEFGSVSCTGAANTGTGQTATVALTYGSDVTCTFVNKQKPTLTLQKNSGGAAGTFNFDLTGATVKSLSVTTSGTPATGTSSPVVINTGATNIKEILPAGWTMTNIKCEVGGQLKGSGGADTTPADGVPDSWNFTAAYGDNIVCSFTNSNLKATRTIGYWSTHTAYANAVWNGDPTLPIGKTPVAGTADQYLCTATPITAIPATGMNQLLGGFLANIANKDQVKPPKRSDLDQARMQLLQQYLAAVLNVHAFGAGSNALLTTARTAYCGTDVAAINAQIGVLNNFNISGDLLTIPVNAAATVQLSKQQANIPFWDVTFH